ncbi:MAG: hypothetical protein GC186_18355 [Rhodobacteraceae bacterium]|nr:hypothetical protein [Paracoccaceae bacterium]
MIFTDYLKETYTPEVFAALCEQFEIPADVRDELLRRLEGGAAVWRRYHSRDEPQPPAHHVRQELATLAKHAAKFIASYRDLSDEARHALSRMHEHHMTRGVPDALTAASPPYPYLRAPSEDPETGVLTVDLGEIAGLIEGLQIVARDAADKVSGGRVGKRRSEALRMWMVNIELIWEEVLKRPFTRDATSRGEPITEAARFCVEAYKPLDPALPASRVLNEMKLCIKRRR